MVQSLATWTRLCGGPIAVAKATDDIDMVAGKLNLLSGRGEIKKRLSMEPSFSQDYKRISQQV
jgi:hypothetical protein